MFSGMPLEEGDAPEEASREAELDEQAASTARAETAPPVRIVRRETVEYWGRVARKALMRARLTLVP